MLHRVPIIIAVIFIFRFSNKDKNFDCEKWDFLLIFITNLSIVFFLSQNDMIMPICLCLITIIMVDNDDNNCRQNAIYQVTVKSFLNHFLFF